MLTLPNIRRTNLLIFGGCTGLMVVAMIMEHYLLLKPCPLCITQRVIVIVIGLLGFLAWIQNPIDFGQKIYASLLSLTSILGITVAGRHVWLQSLPADQAPACGPDLAFMMDVMPFQDVITLMFSGDGNCAEVAWTFLGISIPGWTLAAFIGLFAISFWQLLRKKSSF